MSEKQNHINTLLCIEYLKSIKVPTTDEILKNINEAIGLCDNFTKYTDDKIQQYNIKNNLKDMNVYTGLELVELIKKLGVK